MSEPADALKDMFCGLIAGLESLAPRRTILKAAQAALDLERMADAFVAAADAEESLKG